MSQFSKSASPDYAFGYCTNVHAGITLAEAKANLERIATQVRDKLTPQGRLPVGLWLAQKAAEQLHSELAVPQFGEWLAEHGLRAYTFNGFPQGDFHQPVVKHAVYEPTWLEESRLQYTQQLADILAQLLDGSHGSISTLPLGWPHQTWQAEQFRLAGEQLQRLAVHLDRIAQQTGKEIVLAIEPEPGCVLDTANDMVDFLQQYVFDESRPYIRRHIGVCHDVCHSAVMFESQSHALHHYMQHGVRIGKVQVSSAVEVPWSVGGDSEALNRQTWQQLVNFSEPRYLHQTTRARQGADQTGNSIDMVDDLPQALSQWLSQAPEEHPPQPPGASRGSHWPSQAWRIHFHVPIFVERFGNLLATRRDIHQAIHILESNRSLTIDGVAWFTGDYEVETYAWGVLPPELRVDNLADGIAGELTYLQSVLKGVES